MRSFTLGLCLFVIAFGLYCMVVKGNDAGLVPFIIGMLAFAIIVIGSREKKIPGYDSKHWMNR